jgi:glutathione synthase/RimK-type ligase-like ATP-grasp enzyme
VATLIIVNNPAEWALHIPGVEVISARAYLTDPAFSAIRGAKVFNLCRSYRYQSAGYYVSLLAEARGHKPLPSITAIQDLKSQTIIRIASGELSELIQKRLAHLRTGEFTLSIYFGRNLASRYQSLSTKLFNQFPAPLLRARFARTRDGWQLKSVRAIAAKDIPEAHHEFVIQVAERYFSGRHSRSGRKSTPRFDLAILHDPQEADAPSNARALRRFVRAAEGLGLATELITRDDYARIAEFDGLFIRATTRVNHYTYRFARRAAAEGLVVIDDPDSIVRCANKVYLAETLARHRVPTPRTLIVHRGNIRDIIPALGLPCVLKQPDSAFSRGVYKVDTPEALAARVEQLLGQSELIIAQSFQPTDFDWRVGVLDHEPLYVCRYYMAHRHWQIIKRTAGDSRRIEGDSDTLAVEDAPPGVLRSATRAARLMGRGLYGVDLKQSGRRCWVIEVNDNPNIDAGIEDQVLQEALYRRIMQHFLERIEQRKNARRR